MNKFMTVLFIAFAAMFSHAQAAEIAVGAWDDGETYITYTGDTEFGDYDKFFGVLVEAYETENFSGIVFLNGNGGLASEGERIAFLIRNSGLDTATNGICASACTTMWLAGYERILFEGDSLHFHLPYIPVEPFDAHPYENVKNNYGWGALLNYHNSMILLALAVDLGFGINDPVTYLEKMSESSHFELWEVSTESDLAILGGTWIKW